MNNSIGGSVTLKLLEAYKETKAVDPTTTSAKSVAMVEQGGRFINRNRHFYGEPALKVDNNVNDASSARVAKVAAKG